MSEVLNQINSDIAKIRLDKLEELKTHLTIPQLQFLNRIFPKGISDDQFDHAIRLIERTIKKNENEDN